MRKCLRAASAAMLGLAAGACGSGSNETQVTSPSPAPNGLATIYNFCANVVCQNGSFVYPWGGGTMVQAGNGSLYGTTYEGGAYGHGAVFGVTPGGALTIIYSFCAVNGCPDGQNPYFGLIPASDGNLYGVTNGGGAFGMGSIFRITPDGTLSTLYSFCAEANCADGDAPIGNPIQVADGDLYGIATGGGAHGAGTVYKITLDGTLTTLYSFSGGADGSNPAASLVQASDGNLYGSTYSGGGTPGGQGTVFKITTTGALTTLHQFNGLDGGASQNGLIQAADGNLWGTSKFGGSNQAGTILKMTPDGTLTTMYTFSGSDGSWPNSALVQAANGNIYGTTETGGAFGNGTIFKIGLTGTFIKLYDFDASYGGFLNGIYGGLFQAPGGTFYGTSEHGGSADDGTVFSFVDN